MSTPARRRYDASGRRAAAQERRARIVDVAVELFVRDGWTATTLPRVAAGAGVSTELVQRTFGSKGRLAMAALQRVSFGGSSDLPTAFAALGLDDLPDDAARLDAVVSFATGALVPMAPLVPVLAQAAAQDAVAAAAVADGRRRHLSTSRMLVTAFRPGDPPAELVDEVYLLTLGETFVVLTGDRGWTPEQYSAWLRRSLAGVLGVPT